MFIVYESTCHFRVHFNHFNKYVILLKKCNVYVRVVGRVDGHFIYNLT